MPGPPDWWIQWLTQRHQAYLLDDMILGTASSSVIFCDEDIAVLPEGSEGMINSNSGGMIERWQ